MDSTTLGAQGGWDCVGWLTWLPWLVVRNPRNSYGWCREFAVSIFEASCSLKTCQERATFWAVLIFSRNAATCVHASSFSVRAVECSQCKRPKHKCDQNKFKAEFQICTVSALCWHADSACEPSLRTSKASRLSQGGERMNTPVHVDLDLAT